MSDDPSAFEETLDVAGRIDNGYVIDSRYVVLEPIGRGGFATVFRGHQAHVDRKVAIKVLSVALSVSEDRSFEQRFLREARLAAQLAHPNVVTVYDFGFAGSLRQPYMVMELLDGEPLEQRLARGPLPLAHALELADGALDALAVGHHSGIVHKDLKPANLFLTRTPDGGQRLKVLDFGIATHAGSDDTRFTATGDFIGTPRYAAPEYIRSQEVTPAVDVYQMGLILVEMLCGGPPVVHSPSPMNCLRIHSEGRLAVPTPLIDSPLGPILRRALATDPNDRYPDAAALRDALRALDRTALEHPLAPHDLGRAVRRPLFASANDATSPPPPTNAVPARTTRRSREHTAIALLAVVCVLVIAALVAALTLG